jgi:hypothetical protein
VTTGTEPQETCADELSEIQQMLSVAKGLARGGRDHNNVLAIAHQFVVDHLKT